MRTLDAARLSDVIAKTGFVAHGSLLVSLAAERDYERAKAYLSTDPGERRLFAELEHATGRVFRLRVNSRNDDSFDPNDDTIEWDPCSALRTTSGGRQTPALGLGHEVDHAVERPQREAVLARRFDARYDTAEERRVIRGSEARAARALGEGVRYDHDGTCYRVATPISRNAARRVEMAMRADRIAYHADTRASA